jgi:hypothetical protein
MGQRKFDLGKVLRLCAVAPLGVLLGLLGFQGLTRAGLLTTTPTYRVDEAALVRAETPGAGLRVLFIGNSFTAVNDVPGLIGNLAATGPSAAEPLRAVSYTPGGQRLQQDVDNKTVERLLHAVHWDVVVLQERSWMLAEDETTWRLDTEPYAARLNTEIRAIGGTTLIYETWGYRCGFMSGDTYARMQERLTAGNALLAMDLHAELAPAGRAFAAALISRPGTPFWAADRHHPSPLGSYLAASVLYEKLYGLDPAQSSYDGGLDPAEASWLRSIARQTVQSHPLPDVRSDWQTS